MISDVNLIKWVCVLREKLYVNIRIFCFFRLINVSLE